MDGRLLGPVAVRNGQTIGAVEVAIRAWLVTGAPDLSQESAPWRMKFSLSGVELRDDQPIMEIAADDLPTLDLTFIK